MKKRIVIVDDHESIRAMLVCILKRESQYEIVGEAGTGLKALHVCGMLQPDLVIMDLMLPELSGAEVMRRMHGFHPGDPHPGLFRNFEPGIDHRGVEVQTRRGLWTSPTPWSRSGRRFP